VNQMALTFETKQRIGLQLRRVRDLMSDGKWRTVPEIALHVPGMQTSLSARVRDLRNVLGLTTESREKARGLWEFRVVRT
jgi:hypothetical protein